MVAGDDIRLDSRLRGLDTAGVAEVVQVAVVDDGGLLRLTSAAYRTRLAYLAVSASLRASRQAATRVRWNPPRSIAPTQPHGTRH
jgi:hypothetical protein